MSARNRKSWPAGLRAGVACLLGAAATIASSASAQNVPQALASAPATESRLIHLVANGAPQRLELPLDKAVIVELDRDARDVFVANPAVADAIVRTPRRIFIMALKIGQTNAIFLDNQGRQIGALEIAVGSDVSSLNAQFAQQLPGSNIQASSLNDNIVIGGTVSSVQEASLAHDLAQRFTGGAAEKVINRVTIDQRQQVLITVRVSEMSRNIAKQLGVNLSSVVNVQGVPLVASTGNQFGLVGRALSDLSGAQFGQVCKTQQYLPQVIDAPPALQPAGQAFPDQYTNVLGIIPGTNIPGTALGFSPTNLCRASPNNVQSVVQALERVGLVHTLAEPNLTAVSGEAAKFLAGGEFPVPTSRDRDGNVTVEFKPFGVGLSFTPVVLSKGRISLQISTEVSELTNTGALTLAGGTTTDTNGNTVTSQGLTLPALAVRRTETTVELPSGGSLAIGGLIQQSTKQSIDAFPGIKELPVLGALFRSRDFQNNETELVVTVTAYLVNPVANSQLAGPDDGFAPATDLETTFLGRLNAVYGKGTKLPADVPKEAVGYIVQ